MKLVADPHGSRRGLPSAALRAEKSSDRHYQVRTVIFLVRATGFFSCSPLVISRIRLSQPAAEDRCCCGGIGFGEAANLIAKL